MDQQVQDLLQDGQAEKCSLCGKVNAYGTRLAKEHKDLFAMRLVKSQFWDCGPCGAGILCIPCNGNLTAHNLTRAIQKALVPIEEEAEIWHDDLPAVRLSESIKILKDAIDPTRNQKRRTA